MSVTIHDLNDFHRFAIERITAGGADSLWQLVEHWESAMHGADQQEQNKAAVQAAIRDMERGEQGRSAREVISELRSQITQASDE